MGQLKPYIFEILAANYAQYFAPQYKWHLTKQTGDFNRDFETIKDVTCKWGEAKHTESHSAAVSKSRWDPTLLSAQLSNDVDMILLITCGWIPLEYIVRAEHLRNNTVIKKIAYINREILDQWLINNQISFCNFGKKNLNMFNVMHNIKKEGSGPKVHIPKVIINIYGKYNNSMLEPQSQLETNVPYEINITAFTAQEDLTLKIDIPVSFKIIDKIQLKSLSSIREDDMLFDSSMREFNLNVGYNQILIYGLFDNSSAGLSGVISAENSEIGLFGKCSFTVDNFTPQTDDSLTSEVVHIENLYNECLETKQNNKIFTKYLKKNDLIRNNRDNEYISGYYYYSFNDSYSDNAKKLCQLASKFFFNVDLQDTDEKTVPKVFNSVKKYFDFFLLDLVIGAVNVVFALNTINGILSSEESISFIKTIPVKITDKTMFFLEGVANLNNTLRTFLELLLNVFVMNTNSSIVIADINPCNQSMLPKECSYKYTNNNLGNIEALVDEIYTENRDIKFKEILKCADELYKKTDFHGALFLYNFIYNKYNPQCNCLKFLFRYADCLNHCGSMNKSISIFKQIASQSYEKPSDMRIILEAQTEVFNLRFWKLDTEGLVSDIDAFIEKFYNVLTSGNEKRDLYSYYNCLNRKMTTQYLIGDYEAAETTYYQYINVVDDRQYPNYLAFAYMDSARGLYKKRHCACTKKNVQRI